MSEKHIGEVVQVIGPVLDIRFAHDELPPLLNAIEITISAVSPFCTVASGSSMVTAVSAIMAVTPVSCLSDFGVWYRYRFPTTAFRQW